MTPSGILQHASLVVAPWIVGASVLGAGDEDLAGRAADRLAVERVYYAHRLGNKPPFEQILPLDRARVLVRQDQEKEALLANCCHGLARPGGDGFLF